MEKGTRVGAILGSSKDGKKSVQLLGYGTYDGEEVPPDTGPRSLTGMLNEVGVANPKIVLDDGTVVWGCECWWGSEEKVRARIAVWQEAGYAIEMVRIEDFRG